MHGLMPEQVLLWDGAVLDRFMPMHLLVGQDGVVERAGPTLSRVFPGRALMGSEFGDLFELRASGGAASLADIMARGGRRLRLYPRDRVPGAVRTGMRGLAMALPESGQVLINLSFGIDVVAAVRAYRLTVADFAPTDLAMELLYLAEANHAVTAELRGLNLRLDGARLAAEEEAITDPLTGLKNRRAADAYLARLCATGVPFGVLHMDLDYFKTVNDSLGHAAGDLVLGEVARVLRRQTRAEDCAARIGGDEFVLILAGQTEADHLVAVAERIIAGVSEPILFEGQVARVSASVGIGRSIDHAYPDPALLLADADAALYRAKRAGRGRAALAFDKGSAGVRRPVNNVLP
ncbi:MAG: diguanylate cyclase [Tabrizicola sp.]|uniref:GGDEF domain-containing protein n=1 Tax=Tabrizicola sp. TaxID=2005166 RepID=UPI0027331C58|nr:diguanylate cyclase [Tabrizicola sp.]MDP3263688.1 diguanylate cyclase [Tabrizicola sp.]MDP3647052.1 diguanylate cyclase [Paracoccaceae bacterium]MDZ4066845.1 diguanylate cyclase [Tabrizicola sp.]